MDINNYSYVNSSGSSSVIAESCGDYCAPCIFFELETNYFGDHFYHVYSVLDDNAAEFPVNTSEGWKTMRPAYEQAARFYNSLVPDADAVPLF